MFKALPKHALILPLALLLAVLATAPAMASQAGGSSMGGAAAPAVPVISNVICDTGCLGLRKATAGSSIQISGRNLNMVSKVSFPGVEGRIVAPVSATAATSVQVTVPAGARTGRLRASDDYGSVSGLSPALTVLTAARTLTASTTLRVLEAEIKPRKAYLFGARNPALSFVIASPSPQSDLRVDVVETTSGQIVRSRILRGIPGGSSQTVRWNGLDGSGSPAPAGTYSFRIRRVDGSQAQLSAGIRRIAARASSRTSRDPFSFEMLSYRFPVEGRVGWGDGIGAGRNHQGQDLLTSCGKRIYAARGGTVVFKGNMSGAAGNYVVISGKGSNLDFAYMHLLNPVTLKLGQTVRTGQVIGQVGATGRASTCHLHFEAWGAPGWYKGGSPVSPTAMLRGWYRQ